jgi:hypothetical protein
MTTTKIEFHSKIISWFILPGVIILLFFSCDVLEPDGDLIKPTVRIEGDHIFVLSNNSAFIDLNSKVKTNQRVRLGVTSPTKYGVLTDLGKGLIQYTPSVGKRKARDSFEFTIFSESSQILDIDTVWIMIEDDSTNLPCGVFPADDYVYGATTDVPLTIPVLANDYICGVDSADLVVSIHRPDNTYPPRFGGAEVSGHTIVYTSGTQFGNADKVIYKVHPKNDPENAWFGVVYIAGDEPCAFFLHDDSFAFDVDSLVAGVRIPALQNDSLCLVEDYQINIAVPAMYGNATVNDQAIAYQLSDAQTVAAFESDFFVYEVCIDATCKTARVDLHVGEGVDSCVFRAMADTVDLSRNTIPSMYLDVLYNDSVCDGYSTFTITEFPHYGTASFDETREAILYQRDQFANRNDSLAYEICNGEICSRAKVYIKRE